MLEEAYIAGESPDTELVYQLRGAASTGATMDELLDLIVQRGHHGGFAFGVYFSLSFGVPIPLMKEFGGYASEDSSSIELANLEVGNRIMCAIEDRRETWEKRLNP